MRVPFQEEELIVSYSDDEPIRQGRRGSLRPARAAVDRNVLINRPREIVSSEGRIRPGCGKILVHLKAYLIILFNTKIDFLVFYGIEY